MVLAGSQVYSQVARCAPHGGWRRRLPAGGGLDGTAAQGAEYSKGSGGNGSSSSASAAAVAGAAGAATSGAADADSVTALTSSAGTSGVVSLKTRMPAEQPGLTGWYRPPGAKRMNFSCSSTTRQGLASVSLDASGSFLAGAASFSTSSPSFSSVSIFSSFSPDASAPPSTSAFFFFSASFFFRLAVVDSTAVGARATVVAVTVDRGGGYANRDGLASLVSSKTGILRSALRPIMAVGVNAREIK
mmetsp:Transcript_20818/g.53367  ORF Transcript_20818/g.53367 Transcript_20818/m.53367 type:complete len:245 (+) Transcript_20818:138-872(+)